MQKFETSFDVANEFTEQELMTLLDIQQSILQAEIHQNRVTQEDIDKLFS
ncbi:MAG: hypothetical protein AB1600_11895 [Bacteroidota bacterium]